MQKRAAAAQMGRVALHRCMTRGLSLVLCLVVAVTSVAAPSVAHASDFTDLIAATAKDWLAGWTGQNTGHWNPVDPLMGFFTVDSSGKNLPATVNQPQKYYTVPTSSEVDKSGNVTNYYRGGDTTNTKIIDSYNKTFNTIYNTTNNTNNYEANVKLSNFLNQYTTNNVSNKYTYSADFKSWYYDNTTNNYTYNEFNKNDYTQNNLYYNQDNSRYYISIDNSTDEYYLVDVQYSPTFVTVNYTYNTTNNNYEKVGDVTNVYYYELKDGRNSSTLTAAEVAGLDTGYDVANYELVTDDPNTLSLQHFDGDYTDSSSYNRTFYSQNRSSSYVDSGAFGKAVLLPNGSAAGVTIPNLSSNSSLTFDFRVRYADVSQLGIYFGDTNLFSEVVPSREWRLYSPYDDNGLKAPGSISLAPSFVLMQNGTYMYYIDGSGTAELNKRYTLSELSVLLGQSVNYQWSNVLSGQTYVLDDGTEVNLPTSFDSPGFVPEVGKKYGWMIASGVPSLYSSNTVRSFMCVDTLKHSTSLKTAARFACRNRLDRIYRWSPSQYVVADFSYDNYKSQWVSMRITISGNYIYYFVNGDLVGSGAFTKPTADKFYIKSSGTVYLDELRVSTGSLSSTSPYNPSSSPYDTNKVLALPDKLTANTIYVQHNTPVSTCRIGGVRPSNPATGFLYIPLHDDRTAAQPQLYDGSNWVDVTAMVHNGNATVNVLGYKFSPVGDSPDVDMDAKPERPVKPGEDVDPDTCKHEWEETGRTDATCSLPGSVEYVCSKCEKTKTEALQKLSHTWEVKQTVQTSYDEEGNIVTQGFTIYRCSACGEEYKDSDGTGPPGSSGSGEEGGGGLWDKLGELLGSGVGGILKLIEAVVGALLDALIALVDMITGKLADVVAAVLNIFTEVPKLFDGFLGFLSAIFPFLPAEITLLLTFGIAAVVFIGIIKAIRR